MLPRLLGVLTIVIASLILSTASATSPVVPAPSAPRIATLAIPGEPKLVAAAREVIDIKVAINPDLAASVGLFDDAVRVPSYHPDTVAALLGRLKKVMRTLERMKVSDWPTARQVDHRWLYANAWEARQRLSVEQIWKHRPAEWLEPVANTLLSLTTYAPERVDLREQIAAKIPAMLAEARVEVTTPTRRDIETALGLVDSLVLAVEPLPDSADRSATLAALTAYRGHLASLPIDTLPEYTVIGKDAYEARLKNFLLLPWSSADLLAEAQRELDRVDGALTEIGNPRLEIQATPEQAAAAAALDRDGLLATYDTVVEDYLGRLRAMNVLSVPDDLPPLKARETPAAIIPLSGDGGSMNPPILFGPPMNGWWNVEHFQPDWSQATREAIVVRAARAAESGMGTYAVHEGVPGHHLQLAMMRDNPNPLRTMLTDGSAIEGWALYAEQLFYEGGGFGDTVLAQACVLRSYRGRIRRIFYDVNIETGAWTLQEAADWKAQSPPGTAVPDADLLRAIQWPTQLITYFAGKTQILQLRAEVQQRLGPAWSSRAFHDTLLSAGPIPLSLIRAEVLGTPLPPIE